MFSVLFVMSGNISKQYINTYEVNNQCAKRIDLSLWIPPLYLRKWVNLCLWEYHHYMFRCGLFVLESFMNTISISWKLNAYLFVNTIQTCLSMNDYALYMYGGSCQRFFLWIPTCPLKMIEYLVVNIIAIWICMMDCARDFLWIRLLSLENDSIYVCEYHRNMNRYKGLGQLFCYEYYPCHLKIIEYLFVNTNAYE
jgi:hypothetical protein